MRAQIVVLQRIQRKLAVIEDLSRQNAILRPLFDLDLRGPLDPASELGLDRADVIREMRPAHGTTATSQTFFSQYNRLDTRGPIC
jgi:hypothetical protein